MSSLDVVNPALPLRTDVSLLTNKERQGRTRISGTHTLIEGEGRRELLVIDLARVGSWARTDLASLDTPGQLAVRAFECSSPVVSNGGRRQRILHEVTGTRGSRVGVSGGNRHRHVSEN